MVLPDPWHAIVCLDSQFEVVPGKGMLLAETHQ